MQAIQRTRQVFRTCQLNKTHERLHSKRNGAASLELVMATAVAIPIAGGALFLGFKICSYVFSAFAGLLSMPLV